MQEFGNAPILKTGTHFIELLCNCNGNGNCVEVVVMKIDYLMTGVVVICYLTNQVNFDHA